MPEYLHDNFTNNFGQNRLTYEFAKIQMKEKKIETWEG